MATTLGESFAQALAAKDGEAVLRLLHPELDFRAMTPRKVWEAAVPGDVLDVLGEWFGDDDVIERVLEVQTDAFADRERVGYRLLVRNDGGRHVVEQQAYLSPRDGQIGWLRILCSGYRPLDG